MSSSSAVSSSMPSAPLFDPRDLECSICMKTMSKVSTLVCGHSFGDPCIRRWLQQAGPGASCPMCKANTIILPSPEALAKVQDRRIALQAACAADTSKQKCGNPEEADLAPLFVEEAPEDQGGHLCRNIARVSLVVILILGMFYGEGN